MLLEIKNSPGPVPVETVEEFERRVSATLPDDYRSFLLKYNGGKPVPNMFRFLERAFETESVVRAFYSLGTGGYYDIEDHMRRLRGRLPEGVLPIGIDPGGNQIALALKGSTRGTVYFWDHEGEKHPPDYSNMHPITSSFTELLNKLEDEP